MSLKLVLPRGAPIEAGQASRVSRCRARQSMRCWNRSASRRSTPAVPAVRHCAGRWIPQADPRL